MTVLLQDIAGIFPFDEKCVCAHKIWNFAEFSFQIDSTRISDAFEVLAVFRGIPRTTSLWDSVFLVERVTRTSNIYSLMLMPTALFTLRSVVSLWIPSSFTNSEPFQRNCPHALRPVRLPCLPRGIVHALLELAKRGELHSRRFSLPNERRGIARIAIPSARVGLRPEFTKVGDIDDVSFGDGLRNRNEMTRETKFGEGHPAGSARRSPR